MYLVLSKGNVIIQIIFSIFWIATPTETTDEH